VRDLAFRIDQMGAPSADELLYLRYDTILMGNFFAYPTFKQKFGTYFGEEKGWQVSGAWQTGLSMGSTVGTIFGGFRFPLI